MSGTKCRSCQVVNWPSDVVCRRCGLSLGEPERKQAPASARGPRAAAKRSSYLWTVLVLVVLGAGAYVLFNGFERSLDQINANDAARVARQPANQPPAPLSRTEDQQRRASPFANAIRNSDGLRESDRHNADVQKLMAGSNQQAH